MPGVAAILLALLAFVACSRTVWVKPGATAADFERDKSACTFDASWAGGPIFTAPDDVKYPTAMFLPDCLRGRGWTQQPDAGQ
jgi:hypothetical protein